MSRSCFYEFQPGKMLINAFFKAKFNYCPLVWMLYCSKLNNRMNKLHKRCLRIIYNHNLSIFNKHCVKCVCIRSYSGPHFLGFGLNFIQPECRKMLTRITPNTDAQLLRSETFRDGYFYFN